ncbi:tRNA 2-selenouridine(34) synthase MnmH [Clostridium sp. UBA3061]|uniref:tRNA 2-selenouridine(34) synthase MnmH n=1 Tax=Clostridium sp. UBA3061 TaxID=1946353 RepID=UPI0032173B1F
MSKTIEYKDLTGDYVLVDVRSTGEFNEATINGAVSIPLFNDEERAIIGTIYTRKSTEEAKRLGVETVSKKLPYIYDKIHELEKQHKNVVLFCARGGMRSASITDLLGALGMRVSRIKDGYKGYRAFINEELPKVNEKVTYIVLHGNTGVGKTEILKKLRADGYDVLDLEGCANHRGSILGAVGLGDGTSQKQFESNIYEELNAVKGKYVFIEAESRRIGRVLIPEYIHSDMKRGLHIFVDAPIDFRSKIIIDEYTKNNSCNEEICDALRRLKKHISEKNIEIYCDMVNNDQYEEVVKELMVRYYDPLYTHSSDKYEYDKKLMINSIDEGVEELKSFINNLKCEE